MFVHYLATHFIATSTCHYLAMGRCGIRDVNIIVYYSYLKNTTWFSNEHISIMPSIKKTTRKGWNSWLQDVVVVCAYGLLDDIVSHVLRAWNAFERWTKYRWNIGIIIVPNFSSMIYEGTCIVHFRRRGDWLDGVHVLSGHKGPGSWEPLHVTCPHTEWSLA